MNETTRLLADLVAIPSLNPMGRSVSGDVWFEHRVTEYLQQFFGDLGVPIERQSVAPHRDNIIARFESPGARQSLLFEVHQDTVPIDNMTIEPFAAAIENGRLYGRGACDVKGGMAAMLAAFARLVREKPARGKNVIMACTVDEEHTATGIKALARPGLADMAIVAEPTSLDIVNSHKGVVRWRITTEGRACHSSRPEDGVNAIYRMGQVLAGIERYAEQLRQAPGDRQLGPPSISVGRIEGGASVNIVPDSCVIELDRRLIPGEDYAQVQQQLTAYLEKDYGLDFAITCEEPWLSTPPLGADLSVDLTQSFGALLNDALGSHEVRAVPFGTNASTLAQAGIPSIVFGPGNIAQVHTCDEWIALDQVETASDILYRFARDF